MDDSQIVALYWQRSEHAIEATAKKYGRYCHAIAYNILANQPDAEECVNDTYLGAWNSIPPHKPAILSAYLAKLTRRISLNRWRDTSRQKRGGGEVPLALDELADILPGTEDTAAAVEKKELATAIGKFVSTLPQPERDVFISRYFLLVPPEQICGKFGFSPSKTKSMLFRTRNKLRTHLEKEGLL